MIRIALIVLFALTHSVAAQDAAKRADFAKRYESFVLSKLGSDMYISAHGADNKTLRISDTTINRPFVHQWANDSDALKNLAKLGFEAAELTNGQTVWRFRRSGSKWIAENPTASQP